MLTDTKAAFGAISIVLHWAAAIAMAYLWFTAPDDHGGRAVVSDVSHVTLGSGLAIVLIARVVWRLSSVTPRALSANALLNALASTVKVLLLLDILLIIGTGLFAAWFKGDPVSVFGGLTIPNPVGVHPDLAGPMHGLHALSTNLILPTLLVLHVAGAFKHLVWDRDATLARMLWPWRQQA